MVRSMERLIYPVGIGRTHILQMKLATPAGDNKSADKRNGSNYAYYVDLVYFDVHFSFQYILGNQQYIPDRTTTNL